MHRASRYGTWKGYGQQANDSVCCILQIETATALANLEEIAAVPGVDALFLGQVICPVSVAISATRRTLISRP